MEHFLSCDWGTSSFRLRLVQSKPLRVLAEIKDGQGIADTYKSWSQKIPVIDRQGFYIQIITTQIAALSKLPDVQRSGIDLSGMPVILSGMASSTIGLVDMAYKQLPFSLDGSDLNVQVLRQYASDHPMIVISGARTTNDVMRGEETKILGCASYLTDTAEEIQLLLPGTHAKHVLIKDQQVKTFKSYMTGEFFDVLASHSVLSASIEAGGDVNDPIHRESFAEGVQAAQNANLMHAAFMVRTRQVLHQTSPLQNYHYLSGLLIGSELKELNSTQPLYLVGGDLHASLYSIACTALGIPITEIIDADEALIRGQQVIFATKPAG